MRAYLAALMVGSLLSAASRGQEIEPRGEVEELGQMLGQLAARVAALEAQGDPERAAEIEEIRVQMESLRRRIEALVEAEPPRPRADPERPATHPLETAAEGRLVPEFYGSLRVRALAGAGGDFEIVDRFSRIGLALRYPGGESWSVFGRYEAGVNLVNQNPTFDLGGDPGFAVGEGSDAVVTRLGLVGVDTPIGQLSWGKQWGVYYDVAAWTDQFFTFGGDASGAYAQGDGGINGTGRAETAIQYRQDLGPLSVGLQAQNRDRTENDRDYADSFGGSLVWRVAEGLRLGAAYNEVRDGIEDPGPNDPHLGDRALIVGGTWESESWIVAATYSLGEERERDDRDQYFDSRGLEGFVLRRLDRRWSVFGGVNWLEPDDPGYDGDFRILNFLYGCSYQLNHVAVISGEGRIEQSRDAAGDRSRSSLVALGLNIGW